MDLENIYHEEDLFPREFAAYAEREYGLLFFNDSNKDSYDSNHAIIFKDKITDLHSVLADITAFYREKGIKPVVYQSITDDGYFERNRALFAAHGYEVFGEENRFMVALDACKIKPNPLVEVRKVDAWDDAFRMEIFDAAGEPWESDVAKLALNKENTLFFAAYIDGRPVGMTHAHINDGVCRIDYLLVATNHRRKGVGRAIIHSFMAYCKEHKVENCFLWPDGESAERIYHEAGFRLVEVKTAGRTVYNRVNFNSPSVN